MYVKGKELFLKAEEMVSKLNSRTISAHDACDLVIQFFDYFPTSDATPKELSTAPFLLSGLKSFPYTFEKMRSFSEQSDLLSNHHHQAVEFSFKTSGRMFQNKADDARRDAEGLEHIIVAKTQRLDEEFGEKLAKLCMETADEEWKKKMEELKVMEDSHFGYFNMKMRMQNEITGLLQKMEAAKNQLR